jgi:hypothetical protein
LKLTLSEGCDSLIGFPVSKVANFPVNTRRT